MVRIFDTHCDTIYRIEKSGEGLLKNRGHTDVERMKEVGTYIQVFAAFVDKKGISVSPMNHCLKLIDKYETEINKSGGMIKSVETADELIRAKDNDGVYSILSIEGGEALEGNLSALKMYYKLGVRLITLTWNYANELADGICESRGGGLTDFGREAVALMESLGILVDVSHLSEKGFWDVVECTKYPFLASHSCAKALCEHPRNLTDAQIKTLIERKGCIGVNFYPPFLSDSGSCSEEDIVRHILYILELGGKNAVGLGSDFDGVDYLPQNIKGVESMKLISDRLKDFGLNDEVIDKILFGNFFELFKDTLIRGTV